MSDEFSDLEMLFKTKIGWKITPKLEGDPVYADYVQRVAGDLRKINPPKPRPIKPDGMSDADFIFSLQEKSTQEIMTLQKDPNYVRDWTAPIPENYLAVPDAKTQEELVGERSISNHEMGFHKIVQRAEKNTIGQPEDMGAHGEKRDAGINAFMEGGDGILSVSEINALRDGLLNPNPYDPPEPKWETIPVWKAMWFRLIGRPVRTKQD